MTDKMTDERAVELRAAMPNRGFFVTGGDEPPGGGYCISTAQMTHEEAWALVEAPAIIDHWKGREKRLEGDKRRAIDSAEHLGQISAEANGEIAKLKLRVTSITAARDTLASTVLDLNAKADRMDSMLGRLAVGVLHDAPYGCPTRLWVSGMNIVINGEGEPVVLFKEDTP